MNRAVFMDRDGTLNTLPGKFPGEGKYVLSPEELHIIPSACRAVMIFRQLGYRTFVITNQSCVGRGLISHKVLGKIHDKLKKAMYIDSIAYCSHTPLDQCKCRKPRPDRIYMLARSWGVDLERSYMVGDTMTDVMTAVNAGCIPIKIGEPPFNMLYDFALWLEDKHK